MEKGKEKGKRRAHAIPPSLLLSFFTAGQEIPDSFFRPPGIAPVLYGTWKPGIGRRPFDLKLQCSKLASILTTRSSFSSLGPPSSTKADYYHCPPFEPCRQIVLVTLSTNQAFLIDLRPSSSARHEIFDVLTPEEVAESSASGSASPPRSDGGGGKGKEREVEVVRKKSAFVTARFSPDGRKMFLGTKGGELLVLDGKTRQVSLIISFALLFFESEICRDAHLWLPRLFVGRGQGQNLELCGSNDGV